MATPINTILNWFKTGLQPTEAQFWASWASFWHKDEMIPQGNINQLVNTLGAKVEKDQFDAHKIDPNAHPNLILKARIIPIGGLLVFKVAPNENEAEKERGDYCMGIVEDSFISGNWNGDNDQLKSSYE
ncbi:hypothetical protein NJT12_03265 [Flavobacterium sp. AC]|uniref:Uncharacterized protein n=1 Tax=Flavobacterium azizsancarii TaxID=2961580 RepID=A0ABT4W7U6_9FLAO|nr:hypothetical protein [Flavobacterium azizsancarii]MDA6068630.1 hypothetical protein [Flavobacterium azizsancarii]